ncbi:MAG: MATE family efflux transporter, partial [Rhizobiaceae bacterium]
MNARSQAAFTEGSVLRHVLVMTATGSVGLVAVFAVDALNLFYISRLGVAELAAAVGFAGIVMFMTTSFAIGLTVATSALTARAIGQRDRERAAMLGGTSLLLTLAVSTVVAAVLFPFLRPMLQLLGATGTTLDLATFFMQIVLPSGPALAVGMAASGILRAAGDARRAMYVTLGAALAAAIFDPILIFLLDLRLTGAAISTVISRFVLLAIGFHGASSVHRLVATPNRETLSLSVRPFFAIAFPAIMTQLATPFGNAFVTRSIAGFGDAAVAGWAIIGRVVAVAFGAVFALSGA